ncbi:MAG: InlB B-repeat-containing protein [Clostridia bacterium]|nr:InlB B-repeat-containing protein [Clostridia bacterium]
MKSKIIIALLALCCIACLFSCNKENGNGGGDTSLSISVNFHSENTVGSRSFSSYTGNTVPVPAAAGGSFLGYYTADGVQYFDKNGSQISGLMIADGMHFYAKFEPYEYTLKFYAQSGYFEDNTTEKTVTVKHGDDISLLIPDVYTLNPKYELDGYFDELGAKRYTNGKEVSFSLDSLSNGETLTLCAKFKVRELTVTLNYNDGVSWNDKITVKYGDKIGDLSAYRKADGDMEIATWSLSHMYEQSLPEAVTEDITIFAIWRKYVMVDFMYPGNVIKTQKVYVADGKSCIMPWSDVPGYKLNGWYENAELSGEPVRDVYQSNLKSIYYGKWTDARYMITFNTDGGNSLEPIEYSYGDTVKLPMDVKKYGYLFSAWSIKGKDGLYTEITPDMWGNLELTAAYDMEFIPIFTEGDLKNIANNVDGKYFLANDITLTEN